MQVRYQMPGEHFVTIVSALPMDNTSNTAKDKVQNVEKYGCNFTWKFAAGIAGGVTATGRDGPILGSKGIQSMVRWSHGQWKSLCRTETKSSILINFQSYIRVISLAPHSALYLTPSRDIHTIPTTHL